MHVYTRQQPRATVVAGDDDKPRKEQASIEMTERHRKKLLMHACVFSLAASAYSHTMKFVNMWAGALRVGTDELLLHYKECGCVIDGKKGTGRDDKRRVRLRAPLTLPRAKRQIQR
jgi:hypothetical protein